MRQNPTKETPRRASLSYRRRQRRRRTVSILQLLLLRSANRALATTTLGPKREVREESFDARRHDMHEQHAYRGQRNASVNSQRFQIRPDHARAIIPARIQRGFEVRIRFEPQRRRYASERADAEQTADGEFMEPIHVEAADEDDGQDEKYDVLHDGAHADGEADGGDVEACAFDVAVPEGGDGVAGEDQHEAEDERVGGDQGQHGVGDGAEARGREDLDVEKDDGGF